MKSRTNTVQKKTNPKKKIMKTSLNKADPREAKTQQITGHNLTENNASERATSYFLNQHQDSEISSNQISNLKTKLSLLITLAIALAAFLMTACEDDPEFCSNCSTSIPAPAPNTTTSTDQVVIRSIHPSAGAPGSNVTIVLENFSDPTADQYVTFGPSFSEIIYARYGMMTVRVPMDLKDGDYPVTIRSNGQVARAPSEFKVVNGTN
jgi:hypothetical protein